MLYNALDRPVALTDEVTEALSHGEKAVVAIGVSGGKDSTAVALATVGYLRSIDFSGQIVLIHSDLGMTEWEQSLPKCRELARFLDLELIVTRRKAGGMMERWEGRWAANVKRYQNLECVKLILPWSTPDMRFCTSELKTSPICSELKKRFKGHVIINAVGIRRQESASRAKALVSKPNSKLTHKRITKETGLATRGIDWNPIIEWPLLDVVEIITESGLPFHEAYTRHGMSRVSCAFCILSNACDLKNATRAKENHDLYRRQVELEIASTFSFQAKWLGDVHLDLLSEDQIIKLAQAKSRAERREQVEADIPSDMLYVKGWPTRVPTRDEAENLATVRQAVAEAVGIEVSYTDADSIIGRYTELLAAKEAKAMK